MNKEWTVITIDAGDNVVCDLCNANYTTSTETGGLIFCSSAVCPKCAPQLLNEAEKHNELEYVKARCADGQSFGDFVRQYRKGE